MDPLSIIAAASTVGSTLSSLFGGGGKVEYGLSPEQKAYLNMLYRRLRGPTPSYLTSPITSRYAAARRGISESMGESLGPGSGLEVAQLLRARAGESRALGEIGERYRAGIRSDIGGIVGGTGVRTYTEPKDFSGTLEDLGWLLYTLTNKGKTLPTGRGGGGLQYQPGFLGGY
jgi:hypothetical protein